MKSINLNAQVEVNLTEDGIIMLREHYDSLGLPDSHNHEVFKTKKMRTQLWEIMFLFGSQIHMTINECPIYNEIAIIQE